MGGDQAAALPLPMLPLPTPAVEAPSEDVAAVPLEELLEAAKDMWVRGSGSPAASTRTSIAKVASKELVIKARDAVATVFKAAGLATVRSSWGRNVDKREALYYLLGWALGRGLLPVTERPGGTAGDLGDKFWVWASDFDKELATQKKDVSRQKSKVATELLETFLAEAAEVRKKLLRSVIELGLPSAQSVAATKRKAKEAALKPCAPAPIEPIACDEPDLTAELEEAMAELSEAEISFQAASLRAERLVRGLAEVLSGDPPPPPGPLRDAYLVGFEQKFQFGLKQMPQREVKRRQAAVRRLDDAHRRGKEGELTEAEAALAFEAAKLKAAEARARLEARTHKNAIAVARLQAANERGLACAREAVARHMSVESDARVAGMEAQLAQLRVALAAAEAAEQGVAQGIEVGQECLEAAGSSEDVVQGVLAAGAGVEDDRMLM
jgi:hypothetical protein